MANQIRRPILLIVGVVLSILGLAGFVFVADDLRHTGELAAAGALLLSGPSLAGASRGFLARWLDLIWLPAGLFAGILGGAIFDATGWGFLFGLAGGLALAARQHFSTPLLP